MNYRLHKLVILSCLLLWGQIVVPSILSGTLIKTPHGSISVENVTIGSNLIGYNNKQCIDTSITGISTTTTNTVIIITTNKGDVYAAPDQLFYDPVTAHWIKAENITPNTAVTVNALSCLKYFGMHIIPTM